MENKEEEIKKLKEDIDKLKEENKLNRELDTLRLLKEQEIREINKHKYATLNKARSFLTRLSNIIIRDVSSGVKKVQAHNTKMMKIEEEREKINSIKSKGGIKDGNKGREN